MRNKTVAIILAVVALVVIAVFVIKPLFFKTEKVTLLCKETNEKFELDVKVGSVAPYANPKNGKLTLFNAYEVRYKDKNGKEQKKLIIAGSEAEHGITMDMLLAPETPKK